MSIDDREIDVDAWCRKCGKALTSDESGVCKGSCPPEAEEFDPPEPEKTTAERVLEEIESDAGGMPWDHTLNDVSRFLSEQGFGPIGPKEMPGHLWERLDSIIAGIFRIRSLVEAEIESDKPVTNEEIERALAQAPPPSCGDDGGVRRGG